MSKICERNQIKCGKVTVILGNIKMKVNKKIKNYYLLKIIYFL